MARKYNDRYVRFYTYGSTAVKVEDPRRTASLPKEQKAQKRKPIPFDPIAFAGNVVAVFMAILMIVQGTLKLKQIRTEVQFNGTTD